MIHIDATDTVTWIADNWPVQSRRYHLPAIAPGADEHFSLHIPPVKAGYEEHNWERTSVMIRKIKVACDSTNFDVYLFTKSDGDVNEITQHWNYTGINKFDQDTKETQIFINQDDPQVGVIYCRIFNKGNDTGAIELELYVS